MQNGDLYSILEGLDKILMDSLGWKYANISPPDINFTIIWPIFQIYGSLLGQLCNEGCISLEGIETRYSAMMSGMHGWVDVLIPYDYI